MSGIDLRIHPDSKRPGVMVMLLVYGGDEVKIDRWSTKKYKYGPAAVVRTLGDLGRKVAVERTAQPLGAQKGVGLLVWPCGQDSG